MITLQGSLKYAGPAASAPASTFAADAEVPAFEYSASADGESVVREVSARSRHDTLTLAFADTSYRFVPDQAFVAGTDEATAALALEYALNALQSDDLAALSLTVAFRFRVLDSIELGQQTVELLCVPKLTLRPVEMLAAASRTVPARHEWFALSRSAFERLRKQIVEAGLAFSGRSVLSVLSALTVLDGDAPAIPDDATVDVELLLERAGERTTSEDATKLLALLRKTWRSLFSFPLEVPAAEVLTIAGTLTLHDPAGNEVTAADFTNFTITAEIDYATQPTPRLLSLQFTGSITVNSGATDFALTSGNPVLKNGAKDPVRIVVNALDGSLAWSATFKVNDPALGDLDIRLDKLAPAILLPVPEDSEPDRNRRLRGQIVSFSKECPLARALVLIQARANSDDDWHIVSAGAADASGNFSMPYPYGVYSDARAVTSLAPGEYVGIAVDDSPDQPEETIRDDFLYLLVRNPDCAPAKDGEECDCESADTAQRLPDHSDLIGSDTYTQDIGGSCINLSKPNRTISEYPFTAVVRMTDPDVAHYTLTRIESGLETIDVPIATEMASRVNGLATVASAELVEATSLNNNNPNAATGEFLTTMQRVMTHVDALNSSLAAGVPSLTMTVLADAKTRAQTIVSLLESYVSQLKRESMAVMVGGPRGVRT